jgi:hypothetical protein
MAMCSKILTQITIIYKSDMVQSVILDYLIDEQNSFGWYQMVTLQLILAVIHEDLSVIPLMPSNLAGMVHLVVLTLVLISSVLVLVLF